MTHPSPTLLILAAGMGSRYGGLKQIDPVGPAGETVLDYSVYDALRAGFRKIVFVIRRDIEAEFRAKVSRRFEGLAEVRHAFQEPDALPGGLRAPAGREKPWGTGHAVWCARGELAEPFAVINADDFYGADSFRQLGAFLSATDANAAPPAGCMVGFRLERTLSEHGAVSRGVCATDAHGRLTDVEECPAIGRLPDGGIGQVSGESGAGATGAVPRRFTGAETVSMNCWGFTPALLPLLEGELERFLTRHGAEPKAEFYLPAAVTDLIGRGAATVRVLPTATRWFGVTYREDRPLVVAALRELVREGAYPGSLWG